MKNYKKPKLQPRDKRILALLLEERQRYEAQMNFHNEEALHFAKGSASEISGRSNHIADCSSDNIRHEMHLSLMTSEGDIIEQIDEAIDRLENGDYGNCQDCECVINPARLEALPHARLCVKCKELREANDGKNPMLFEYDDEGHEIFKREAS